MIESRPRTGNVMVGWVLAVLMLSLATVGAIKHTMFIPTDYSSWHGDWNAVQQCLMHGGSESCKSVSKFPLAYLANAAMAGSPDDHGRRVLTVLNALCLLLPLIALLLMQGILALTRAGWVYVAAISLSPIPMFYVATGALELQSAVFCGLYIGAFARTLATPGLKPGGATLSLLVCSGLIFPLYKDTIAVFMGFAMLLPTVFQWPALLEMARSPENRRQLIRVILLAAGPVAVSQALAGAYCWFKYGVPLPLAYMHEAAEATPSLRKSAEFFAGSLLSPNGGVLVFWGLPAFVAAMGWRSVGLVPRRQVILGAVALCTVASIAFAHWWATFGWDSWGNRLMVPSAFAALVASLLCLRPRTQAEMDRRSIAPVVLAYSPLLVCSAYYIAIPYTMHAPKPMENSLWYGPACAHMRDAMSTEAIAQGLAFWKGDAYYQCARERMLHVPGP